MRNKGQFSRQQPAKTKEDIRRLNEYKPPAPARLNPLSNFGMAKFMRHTEEDDELALTLNNMGKKPMAIFRDEEAPSPGMLALMITILSCSNWLRPHREPS